MGVVLVGEFKQNIGVAGLIERTPTGQVLAAKFGNIFR